MNRFLDARVISGALVGFLIALMGSCGAFMLSEGGLFGGKKERLETTIVLEPDPANGFDCRASDPLQLRTKHRKRIRWKIFNRSCATAQVVELRNFREKSDSGFGAPDTLTTDPLRTEAVAPGRTVQLDVQLNKTLERETYFKYDIANGPNADSLRVTRDPDIEMWDK